MELKRGFKQTVIGLIPEDWEIKPLGELFETQLGKMLDEQKNTGVRKPYLGNSSVQWGRIEVSSLATMRMGPKDLVKYRLSEGDLLVCEGGEVGRSAIWSGDLEECYFQKALHRLRPKAAIDPRFVQAIFHSFALRGLFANYVTQTSIAHLPQDRLVQLLLPVPSLAEQNAIAGALADMDATIAGMTRLLVKKRALRSATWRRLLTGEVRLEGFTIPWVEKRLGEVATVVRGASPRPIADTRWFDQNSSVGWVRISDVVKGAMYLDRTTQRLSEDGISRSRRVERGSVIMSIAATVGRPTITRIDACIHDGFVVFEDAKIDASFLYFLLCFLEPGWSSRGQTGSQTNINTTIIKEETVFVPADPKEQAEIARVLMEMDEEIQRLEDRSAKFSALKQAMMQALLTGRVRLPVQTVEDAGEELADA